MAIRTITVPFRDGFNIGVGADLATGSPMGFAVDGEAEGVDDAHGATVNFVVRRIFVTEELHRSLGIDAEASYGSGAFGAGVSARFSFAKDCAVQSTSLFLMISSRIDLEHKSITKPRLATDAAELIDNTGAFALRFGNMFVRGIDRGGLFIGVYRLDVHSEKDQLDISAELEGSYGLFSASVAAKFNEVRSKYRSDALVSMYHEGGPVDLKINDPTVPQELLINANRWLESFQADPSKNAVPFSASLAPITIANGPLPPNAADIEHAQDTIVICAKERLQILDQMNLLHFVLSHQEAYDWTGDSAATPEELANSLNGCQLDLDLVAECASLAINHPAKAKSPAKFALEKNATYPMRSKPVMPRPKPIVPVTVIPAMTVVVPDVLAEDSGPARAKLELLGLVCVINIQSVPGLLPGVVGFQDPFPGSSVPVGTTVTLVVAPS